MFYPVLSGYPGGYAMASATAAESSAREARTDVELFKHDLDRLLMITEALWTLMKQEHGYTDDVLIKLIQDIDKRKVVVEGVAAKEPPLVCPACGRLNQAKRSFCMYCGKPISGNPFAR
ncbi:MAG TPA: zinc ribbon domain-containing protein [Verrucomicrobiae bacterium]|nr:zinc ribbon domain-containing protein [Verrucomicrobiae bacterium]